MKENRFCNINIKQLKKRIIAYLMILGFMASLLSMSVAKVYALSGSINTVGTNRALGSPLLDKSFNAEDWNKWEMVVWGIFLSNFCTPFIDDYNSAFNTSADYGSKGAGAVALNFGSGQDVQNSTIISDLTQYAINSQMNGGVKPIYVSYNEIKDFAVVKDSMFSGNSASGSQSSSTDSDTSGVTDTSDTTQDIPGTAVEQTNEEIREATVKDLLFTWTETDNTTWAKLQTTDNVTDVYSFAFENYPYIASLRFAEVPTFAIASGSGSYQTIFDYTDSYDLSCMCAVLARGIYSDYATEFGQTLSDMVLYNPENYKLVLDTFGNICTVIDGTYKVIIPAAANQHLTTTPSINLVNSLFFNSSTKTTNQTSLLYNAGQGEAWWNWIFGLTDGDNISSDVAISTFSGVSAFTNRNSVVNPGQTVFYFDTDTIVMNDAFDKYLEDLSKIDLSKYGDAEVTTEINEALKYLTTHYEYKVDVGDTYEKLYNLDINNLSHGNYGFKIETANLDDSAFNVFSGDVGQYCKNMFLATSQISNLIPSDTNAKVLTTLTTPIGELSMFGDPMVIPVQLAASDSSGYNGDSARRQFGNWVYQAYNSDIETNAGRISSQDVRNAVSNSDTVADMYLNLIMTETNALSPLMKGFISYKTDLFDLNADIELLDHLRVDDTLFSFTGKSVEHNAFAPMLPTLTGIYLPADDSRYEDGLELNYTSNGQILTYGSDLQGILRMASDLTKYNGSDPEPYKSEPDEYLVPNTFSRSAKVYSTSEVMQSVANILGVREGTDFAVYSSYIYLTYLDWYGILDGNNKLSSTVGGEKSSNLNQVIFNPSTSDILNVDITKLTELYSSEDKEEQILNWTYTLLNPTAGREYRSNIILTGISDWIYDTYLKIVYGNSSSYNTGVQGVTTNSSGGFLSVEGYSENFVTSWFIDNYAYIIVFILGGFLVFLLIYGVLNKKKFSWYLVSIFVAVTMILILPSSGDIVPSVANNFIQDMFNDKKSYWAISESVTNATMENDYVTGDTLQGVNGSLSLEEQAQVVNLVKELNTLYLDRSLNIRQDISKKITQTNSDVYEEVQSLRTARWLLPMIMRQFTASDSSSDYVYIPLSDKYDDLSNLYWYYKPEDALYVNTINAKQTNKDGTNLPNYKNTSSIDVTLDSVLSRSEYFKSYTDLTTSTTADDSSKHASYLKSSTNNVHTYSYMLPYKGLLGNSMKAIDPSNYNSYDDWAEAYATNIINNADRNLMLTIERKIENEAGKYSRFDRNTMSPVFGFLWNTENPFHYFYNGIKDSMQSSDSYGRLVGDIQGTYVTLDDGSEVRTGFMYADNTGYVKDILDLEEMFKNMIPYMYSVQLLAEGYGDVEGVFSDDNLIEDYEIYKNNPKSWLFRSNWVTKIMENSNYHSGMTIGLADGTRVRIDNMLMPNSYTKVGRDMIFSEAQMHEEGLSESDLSLVELKCVQINRDVAREWTLLLNYVNVPGMTKEVLVRQMALDALMTFNSEFSHGGSINRRYIMYPTSIDLRSISFDSIMKMLMLNVTHNTSYIYGDTMQTIVESSDVFTAIILLLTAFICSTIIPLVRNIVLGVIFFMGFVIMTWTIFKPSNSKVRISVGYVGCNLIFLALTLVYFEIFNLLTAITSTDQVLNLSQVEINTGNPVWCLLIVLAASILYIIALYNLFKFCIRNYRDLGGEVFIGLAGLAVSGIAGAIHSLGDKLRGRDYKTGGSSGVTESKSNSSKNTTSKEGSKSNTESSSSSESTVNVNETKKEDKTVDNEIGDLERSYNSVSSTNENVINDLDSAKDIDERIERGKKKENKNSKKSSNTMDSVKVTKASEYKDKTEEKEGKE